VSSVTCRCGRLQAISQWMRENFAAAQPLPHLLLHLYAYCSWTQLCPGTYILVSLWSLCSHRVYWYQLADSTYQHWHIDHRSFSTAKLSSTLVYSSPPYFCFLSCILGCAKSLALAYSEPVPEHGNREGCGGRASGIKTPRLHGWPFSRCHLCGCCRPASGHTVRGVSERRLAINRGSHQIHN